jgi:PAS domain S-box-containing protein
MTSEQQSPPLVTLKLFERSWVRYLFAGATVAAAFGLRKLLEPLTGTGAQFVLFFGAVLVTNLLAGTGPGILAMLLSTAAGTGVFVARAGNPLPQAAWQAALFGLDCVLVVVLAYLTARARTAAARSEARIRDLVALAPDAFFLLDLRARLVDVNQSACCMLGYTRAELMGKTIFDIFPTQDASRIEAVKADLMVPGRTSRGEWTQRRKDGTYLPVEVSTNILPDGRWQVFARDVSERKQHEGERQLDLNAMERLHGVSLLYLRDQRLEAILHAILEAAIALAEADSGSIQLVDPSTSDLKIAVHSGFPAWWVDYWNHVSLGKAPVGKPQCGTALERGERVIVEDISKDPIIVGKEALDVQLKAGIRAFQSTPLVTGSGTAVGMISTHYTTPRRPPERAFRFLDLLARQLADIVERVRSEAALRRAEAKASGILTTAADGIIGIDAEYKIREWNHGAERIFGYSSTEVLGSSFDMLISEKCRASHREDVTRFASEAEAARSMENRSTFGLRKNGQEFPISATISKFEVERERTLTVTVRDVSEDRRIENEQRVLAEVGAAIASKEYQDTLKKVARAAVTMADFAFLFVAEEERGEDLRRVAAAARDPAKEWVADLLMSAPFVPGPMNPVLQTFRSHRSSIVALEPEADDSIARDPEHLRALRAMGARSGLLVPLLVADQSFGVLALGSVSRPFEERDMVLAEELARRSALFIQNERLHRTERSAIRARDEVLHIVAHDLRNPLSIVRMEAQMLGPRNKLEKEKERIVQAAERMDHLIQDLLEVARIEAGQLKVERARLSPESLLHDSMKAQGPLASSASVAMRLEVRSDLPNVCGDKQRILQVLENLIGNAIKFSSSGAQITAGAAQGEHDDVRFWVCDTGPGMSPDQLEHIFDRFWQKKKEKRGAGLGLSIARGIVEAHGGHIWVDSAEGKGSTFHFTVPRAGTDGAQAAH